MTTWDSADVEEWTGDQWEFRRLTEVTVRTIKEGFQTLLIFLEDETEHLVLLDDASVLAAANRLGAGGWNVAPMSTETGEVPAFLMHKAWEFRTDVRSDGARWTRYWLSRRRLLEELSANGGTEPPASDWLDDGADG
jgi:hypothetical protein